MRARVIDVEEHRRGRAARNHGPAAARARFVRLPVWGLAPRLAHEDMLRGMQCKSQAYRPSRLGRSAPGSLSHG